MSGSWAQAQISVVLTLPPAARALATAERPSPVPQLPPQRRLAMFDGELVRAASVAYALPCCALDPATVP